MTRQEVIKYTATEIMAMNDQGVLDQEVLELTLMSMALEIDNFAFMRHLDSMDRAIKGCGKCAK